MQKPLVSAIVVVLALVVHDAAVAQVLGAIRPATGQPATQRAAEPPVPPSASTAARRPPLTVPPPSALDKPDLFTVSPEFYNRRPARSPRARPVRFALYPAYVAGYGIGASMSATPYTKSAPAPAATGILRLEVAPLQAQLYVDGYFAGNVGDIARGVALEPGPHHIEIRAPGYEALSFDVKIVSNQTVTYRGDLQRVEPQPPPAPIPVPVSGTFYIIPGCYAGNRPPTDSRLSAGCDVRNLRTERF